MGFYDPRDMICVVAYWIALFKIATSPQPANGLGAVAIFLSYISLSKGGL